MTSSRPYLIRALYEWIVDNRLTPYIIVDAELPEVFVPRQYVSKGQIVLNISPDAVYDLLISNIALQFHASFSGISHHVKVSIISIKAIYAQENGEGMFFGEEPGGDTPPDNSKFESPKDKSAKKPQLKIIK